MNNDIEMYKYNPNHYCAIYANKSPATNKVLILDYCYSGSCDN